MKALPGRTYSVTSACPNAMILAQYASGMLTELIATEVSDHIDECSRCQRIVDDMSQRNDSLLDAIRHQVDTDANNGATLNRLIADAQQFAQTDDPPPARQRSTNDEPVAIDEFVGCLRKSRLLNDSEVELLVEQYEPTSSEAFAKQLISRNKLTQFQAKALLKGRWKGLVLGNYTVLEKLGEGGMGYVFKARHRRMGNIACIKVLQAAGRKSPDVLERFRREARTVARLDHPNIVVAHDADETGGIPFLAMEYIDGSDLSHLVQEHGPLSVPLATDVILQVARALAYAHRQGIVHRDIKPHNLMMPLPNGSFEDSVNAADSSIGTIKLLDLGLARFDRTLAQEPDAMTAASMTNTGVIMGTVDYMSPEQALNGRKADGRSDIYSLGCTMFYILTGEVMFGGETLMEKLVAHRENGRPSLCKLDPSFPPALDTIFHRMVHRNPDRRYQSMDELVEDLEGFVEGKLPIPAVQHNTSDRPVKRGVDLHRFVQRQKRATRRNVIILSVLTLAGLWFTSGWWWPGADGTPGSRTARHPGTVAAGGNGRVLVVVPNERYDDMAFFRLVEECRQRNVALITTTSANDAASPISQLEYSMSPDIPLSNVRPGDFDAIVFCGGTVNEFRNPNSPSGQQTRRIIQTALDTGAVVAGFGTTWSVDGDWVQGTGWDIVRTVMQEDGEPLNGTRNNDSITVAFTGKHKRQLVFAPTYHVTDQLMSFIFDDALQPDHPETKVSGGPGRFLLAVSHHGYDSNQLRLLKAELDRQGIEYQTASGISGDLKNPTDGSHEKIDLRLDEVRVRDFDAVVFCGGGDPMHEFGKGKNHAATKQLVVGMLDEGRMVAAIDSGRVALDKTVGLHDVSFKAHCVGVNVAPAKSRDGTIVLASEAKHATDMLSVMLENL